MKVLLVEDEPLAQLRLEKLLSEIRSDLQVVGRCDSVKSVVQWLFANEAPDVAFMDIELGDGTSFEVFEQVSIAFPVIFVTAYDQYAVKAFKVNGLDYILKPYDKSDLTQALEKLVGRQMLVPAALKEALGAAAKELYAKKYKERFLIKVGEHLKMIESDQITCFYSQDKGTYLCTFDGRQYAIDQSLEQVDLVMDPTQFFRISRNAIVNIKGIQDLVAYSNSRLKVIINGLEKEKSLIVSRERVKEFKNWLED